MTQSLRGRSVAITGGSKGIGKGIARVFAGAGAKVAIISRHVDQAEAAAKEIGNDAFGLAGDVTSLASMEQAMKAFLERLPHAREGAVQLKAPEREKLKSLGYVR